MFSAQTTKESILEAIAYFSDRLFSDDPHAIYDGLEAIGRSLSVDRAYYWENSFDTSTKQWVTSQRFEWCQDQVVPQIDNPMLQNIPFTDVGDFMLPLSGGEAFSTHVTDMSSGITKTLLEEQDILSILVLPVMVQSEFYGFVGFDSCTGLRTWQPAEIKLLEAFVHLLEKSISKKMYARQLTAMTKNFDNFFNTVDHMLFILDLEGNMLEMNQAVFRKTGYSRDELTGKSVLELHPEHRREEANKIVGGMVAGTIDMCPVPLLTKYGFQIPVETRVCLGEWNGERALFGITKDVSDIAFAEEKFSKAFNNSGTLMMIVRSGDGHIIDVNATLCSVLGVSVDEIIGRSLYSAATVLKNPEVAAYIKDLRMGADPLTRDVALVNRAGIEHHYVASAYPSYIGVDHCWVISLLDITEKRTLQREIETYNTQLESMVDEKIQELADSHIAAILSLVKLAESRDVTTGNHLRRIEESCNILGGQLATRSDYAHIIDRAFLLALRKASVVHDIGKVAIPDCILLKEHKLTDEEFDEMKQHTVIGAETLRESQGYYSGNAIINMGVEIALNHHERWDGKGYPRNISGNDIPLAAQIVSICDVYDALRSKRCYKEARTHDETMAIIRAESGGAFSPTLVESFLACEVSIRESYDKWS